MTGYDLIEFNKFSDFLIVVLLVQYVLEAR